MIRLRVKMLFFGLIFCCTSLASGQQVENARPQMPAADIDYNKRTRVLVLGTPHLRSYGDDFNRSALDALLGKLEEFAPDMVGIEALAPRVVHQMLAQERDYASVLQRFAGEEAVKLGRAAQAATGLDWSQAMDRAEELLRAINEESDAARLVSLRKEAVVILLATYDRYSALLQWQYLPEEERGNVPHLDAAAYEYFEELLRSPNEIISISLKLATRLGLQRLYPIDDHMDKDDFLKFSDQFQKDMEANELIKSQPWKAFFDDMVKRQEAAYEAGNLLPFYEYVNSQEYGLGDVEAQWQVFFRTKFSSGLDRSRAALWEVRNLAISAHIRRATASKPGGRMLVVIGASHRYFLETYLAQMMDVEIVRLPKITK